MTPEAIRAPLSRKRIQSLYDSLSSIYDILTRYEEDWLEKVQEIVHLRSDFIIYEAGFGTGKILVKLAKELGNAGRVYALDISRKMAKKARRDLDRLSLSDRVDLVIGDAENAPFNDATFDLVLSSYMIDLIDTPAIPMVLSEFKRVLKPNGRLVLVNLSKGSRWYNNMKPYEWVYRRSPSMLGGCRPVVLAPYLHELEFKGVNREFVFAGHLMPTEIVWASKGE